MALKARREVQEIGLSFLDVICCGFGAIILLLMITDIAMPLVLERTEDETAAQVEEKQLNVEKILGEIKVLERSIDDSEISLDELLVQLSVIMIELTDLQSTYAKLVELTRRQAEQLADLTRARQTLTDEMQRLLGSDYRRQDNTIGGIPVDSEYIIFVIDTSGSMQAAAWRSVVQKLTEVLNVYPIVKGIQVMNDMGDYMFPRTQGEWIEDTVELRGRIIERLKTWTIYSNSSPVEGIEEAINTFYDPNKNISIYVFGDDFQGRSVETVVDRIDRVNIADEQGNRRVRIHAVGFPVYFDAGYAAPSVYMFTLLMRELTYRNNGTFVGLHDTR